MPRRCSLMAPALAALAALLVAGPALSALRVGTNGSETLVGTKSNDHITGDGGSDLLQGKAGNDTYFFANNWGDDQLIEKPAEGTDTLNFRGVTGAGVDVYLVREWPSIASPYAFGPGGSIDFETAAGYAVIENVILGNGDGDLVRSGTGTNILQPGGGGTDNLQDHGGWNDGAGGRPELPASNDIFKGFATNIGTVLVIDWGGTKDVVDMRPFSTEDVYISRRDFDGFGTQESLQIVTSPTTQVVFVGHYGEYSGLTLAYGQNGRIEKVIFSDATFTTSNGLADAVAASADAASGQRVDLVDAAPGLAKQARALLAAMPDPGAQPVSANERGGAARSGSDAGVDAGRDIADTEKSKKDKK